MLKLLCVCLLLKFQYINSERKIAGGAIVQNHKRYMVYMVKAPVSDKKYDEWLCGGAIVSEKYVATAAACVEDVQKMYLVAGYEKYVAASRLEQDECTKRKRKRIVYTIVPKSYSLGFDNLEEWSKTDLALLQVDSPFDFTDESYKKYCSYKPNKIPINFDESLLRPGTLTMALGWGHLRTWRDAKDKSDYNQELLHYTTMKIIDKAGCAKYYGDIPAMSDIIEKHMICTDGPGLVDDYWMWNDNNGDYTPEIDDSRKTQYKVSDSVKLQENENYGICQNDHGGPLVANNGEEVLIGIASVFRVNEDSECIGPFLFTSILDNRFLFDCVLDGDWHVTTMKKSCNTTLSKVGLNIIRTKVY